MRNKRNIGGETFIKIKGATTSKRGYSWFNNGKSRFKEGYKSVLLKD